MIPIIWSAVFVLPSWPAEMMTPSLAATLRSAVTLNSRARSTTTAHAGMRPIGTIQTRHAMTMSLSASGSMNLPSTLTTPSLRAR